MILLITCIRTIKRMLKGMHKFVCFLWKWTKRLLIFITEVVFLTAFTILKTLFFAALYVLRLLFYLVLLLLIYAVSLLLNAVTLPLFLLLYIVCCLFKRNRPSLARFELTLYPSWASSVSAGGSAAAGSPSRTGNNLSASIRSRAKNSLPAGTNARAGRGNTAGTAGAGAGARKGSSAGSGSRTGKGTSAGSGSRTGKGASAGSGSRAGSGTSAGTKASSAGKYKRSCSSWLRKQGFSGVKMTPASDNSGVDLLAEDSQTQLWVFCCRMSSSELGADVVRGVLSGRMQKGAACAGIITNSELTDAARTLARDNNVKVYEHVSV